MSDPQQIDLGVHRSQVVKPPRLPLSAEQVRAIYSVMRTFRDDDRSRVAPEARFLCARCGCSRPLAGSLDYGGARLCNGCATDYELLRTAGLERDLLLDDGAC
jgi:formate dehydrogenase maturation protein FdhE